MHFLPIVGLGWWTFHGAPLPGAGEGGGIASIDDIDVIHDGGN